MDISLRDYFAAASLQGILIADKVIGGENFIAEEAYLQADAMLAARDETPPKD